MKVALALEGLKQDVGNKFQDGMQLSWYVSKYFFSMHTCVNDNVFLNRADRPTSLNNYKVR